MGRGSRIASDARPSRYGLLNRPRACAAYASALLCSLITAPVQGWNDDDDKALLDQIAVTATRNTSSIHDQVLFVEAVPADEIEENLTVQPGNLKSLLNELPGVRMQSTASGLGGAGVQMRGMPTRDTLVLTDGLPLLGAAPGSFGLLQTPPIDLARVEIVKGAASALYGGAALGGVLNMVSLTPAAEPFMLANVSTPGGRDVEGFFTHEGVASFSETLTAGVHDQSREEVSGADWADIPGYRRYTLRPRVWWKSDADRSLLFTAGMMDEHRQGGTGAGQVLSNGVSFAEELHTRRVDGGAVGHWLWDDTLNLDEHWSATSTRLDRISGAQRVASTQTTVSGEGTVGDVLREHAWVVGLAFQHDGLSVPAVTGVGHSYNVPGVFAQDQFAPANWFSLAGSARVDVSNDYGTFLSPRLSTLIRQPSSAWSLRASAGGGYAAPTPFVEEVETVGLGSLLPLRGLRAERAVTESLDAQWTDDDWDVNIGVFNSGIRDALAVLSVAGERLQVINAAGPRRAPGAEVLVHYDAKPLQVIGSWTAIHATDERVPGVRLAVPLVPRNAGELGAIFESEMHGRVGLELGYTGRQTIEDDPFRRLSEPYVELNALSEFRCGGTRLFLNMINLTNVRQTRFDPLVRQTPGIGGNPITDIWAPLQGRTFNLGIRVPL